MKVQLTFKTPDALFYACEDLTDEETREVERVAKKFMEYYAYLTVELCTETETCKVLEN